MNTSTLLRSLKNSTPDLIEHPRVLIYTENDNFSGQQFFDIDSSYLYQSKEDMSEICRVATHWMPLPSKGAHVVNIPNGLHNDSQSLVLKTAETMADKMYRTELKRGLTNEWASSDWKSACIASFLTHIDKGDPSDLVVYAAMMVHHGWTTHDVIKSVVNRAVDKASQDVRTHLELVQAVMAMIVDAGITTPITDISGPQVLKDIGLALNQRVTLPDLNLDHALVFHHALSDGDLGADEADEILTGLKAVFTTLKP